MYPEYRSIEEHIKRTQLERSLYLAEGIADCIVATVAGCKRLTTPVLRRGRVLAERAWLGVLGFRS